MTDVLKMASLYAKTAQVQSDKGTKLKKGRTLFLTPADREIFHDLLRQDRWKDNFYASMGELVLAVARTFLGRPYAVRTLDRPGQERLVINLRQMDCFTLVETSLALSGLVRAGKTSLADFAAALTTIRYRNGVLDGYASRLHYCSDWFYDGEKKGIIRDITAEIGGERLDKKINFMTVNVDKYPALKNKDVYARMLIVEKACSNRPFHYIPKARLRACEDKIVNGDLIAITTDLPGLDISHMGIAVRMPRGLHLLHASRQAGEVTVSGETLFRYLKNKKSRQGIMVARVLK